VHLVVFYYKNVSQCRFSECQAKNSAFCSQNEHIYGSRVRFITYSDYFPKQNLQVGLCNRDAVSSVWAKTQIATQWKIPIMRPQETEFFPLQECFFLTI